MASEKSADGHYLLDGAKWHYPAQGRPHECAIPGCDRVLGVKVDTFDQLEADDATEVDAATDATPDAA